MAVSSSTASRKFLQKAKSVTDGGEILNGRDLYELHRAVKSKEVDILFGNTKCKPIAKDEDVAFVRCGFPVYDRVGYHRYGVMGYHGGGGVSYGYDYECDSGVGGEGVRSNPLL